MKEDKDGIEDNLEEISARYILLLQPPETFEPMIAVLKSLQAKLQETYGEDDGPMEVCIEGR